jgi:hypothetical protein
MKIVTEWSTSKASPQQVERMHAIMSVLKGWEVVAPPSTVYRMVLGAGTPPKDNQKNVSAVYVDISQEDAPFMILTATIDRQEAMALLVGFALK